jgi:hypothetical protein
VLLHSLPPAQRIGYLFRDLRLFADYEFHPISASDVAGNGACRAQFRGPSTSLSSFFGKPYNIRLPIIGMGWGA